MVTSPPLEPRRNASLHTEINPSTLHTRHPDPLTTNPIQLKHRRKDGFGPLVARKRAVTTRQFVLMPPLDILPGLVPDRRGHFQRRGGADVHDDAVGGLLDSRAAPESRGEEIERVPFQEVLRVSAVTEEESRGTDGRVGQRGCLEVGRGPGDGGAGAAQEACPLSVVLVEQPSRVVFRLLGSCAWSKVSRTRVFGATMSSFMSCRLGVVALRRTLGFVAWIHGLGAVVVARWMLCLLFLPVLPNMTQAALAMAKCLLSSAQPLPLPSQLRPFELKSRSCQRAAVKLLTKFPAGAPCSVW